MSDPRDSGSDSESPTLVPDSRSVSPAATRVQSQPPASDANTILSLGRLPSDAPTMIGDTLRSPSATSDAPTLLDVRGSGGLPPPRPASSASAGQLPALLPGMMLGGRYEILQTIGEGGMGAVYKAEDRELGRTVALKVIRPELASNPEILQRFKQEILLASKVTDRNIIRTVWLRVPELPLKPPLVFVYTALMVCGEPLTVRVAVAPLVAVAVAPDPDSVTAPNGTPSMENWTEPVGVAVSPEVLSTVAVKVTDCPKIDGFTEEVTVVEVGAQVGIADVVLDGTLSCGGFGGSGRGASTAVTKYE